MYHVPRHHVAPCHPRVAEAGFVTLYGDVVRAGGQVAVVVSSGHYHEFVLFETTCRIFHYGESLRQYLEQYLLYGVVDIFCQMLYVCGNLLFLFDGYVASLELLFERGYAGFVVGYSVCYASHECAAAGA